jgi:hypothetical protein
MFIDPKIDPYDFLVARRHAGLTGLEVDDHDNKSLINSYRELVTTSADQATPPELTPKVIQQLEKLLSAASYRRWLQCRGAEQLCQLLDSQLREALAADGEQKLFFFHDPRATADFSHYGQAAGWRLEECVALSFGKDPEQVSWETVAPYMEVSKFAKDYERRRDLILRASEAKQISDFVAPAVFVAWAKRSGIDLPPGLVQACRTKKPDTDLNKPLLRSEREALLKLVGGMAIAAYRYDPELKKNPPISEICSDLELLGLHLEADTVRKYVKQGANLVEKNTSQQGPENRRRFSKTNRRPHVLR